MREIKFRAWDGKKMWFDVQEAYDYIVGSQANDENIPHASFDALLDDEDWSVMQYTGLKDKNGVEIYEGDIVRELTVEDDEFVYDSPPRVVEYRMGAGFIGFYPGLTNLEVIGNIYENKDLLT